MQYEGVRWQCQIQTIRSMGLKGKAEAADTRRVVLYTSQSAANEVIYKPPPWSDALDELMG